MNASKDLRFSSLLPSLQIDVNSSSLGPFKLCPRRYQYEIVRTGGKLAPNVHLTFGSLLHQTLDAYEILRAQGAEHEEALQTVLITTLKATWNSKLARPWISGHAEKNRISLLRTVVWYLDHWNAIEGYRTLRLNGGLPASELAFRFDSGYKSATGEAVFFVGKIDRIVEVESLEANFVLDTKSTGYSVEASFFAKFTPDNQFSLYAMAGRTCFFSDVQGVLLDGVQIGATFARFSRGVVRRSEAALEEWLKDAHFWLGQMSQCAEANYWPQNDKACAMYGGCPWRPACSADPKDRDFVVKQLTGPSGEDQT